jgi:hypothetical protein
VSEDNVRARVLAFIADFREAWDLAHTEEAIRANPSGAMGAWRAELAGVAAVHCAPKVKTGEERTWTPRPAHDPVAEQITSLVVDGDRAMVRSSIDRMFGSLYKHYEYELGRVDGEWLITRIGRFMNPPGLPLVEADEATRLLGLTSLDRIPAATPSESGLDLGALFEPGLPVKVYGETAPRQIVEVGDVTTRSGVLLVGDIAHASTWLVPLSQRVPAGTYPVQVARASDRNVAMRLRLSDEGVTEWRRAERADGNGHVVAVDYRNVAICDLESLLGCDTQTVERLFSDVVDGLHESAAVLLPLRRDRGAAPDAVAASSGWGDGEYPVYWGVSKHGLPVQLLVDFLLVEDETDGDAGDPDAAS